MPWAGSEMNRLLCAVAIALAPCAPAHAQSLKSDCVRDSAELVKSGAWSALRPSEVAKRLAAVRMSGKWSALADSLRVFYTVKPAGISNLTDAQQNAVHAELDTLRQELAAAERDPSVLRRGQITDRFTIDFDAGPPVAYTMFLGRRTTQVEVTLSMPTEARRSVCWLGFAASDVVRQAQLRALTDVANALTRLDTRWDNFMERGYSMLPHEVFINGFMPRSALEPPPFQLIVVHPSAGTQIVSSSVRTLRDGRREDVLTLEPLGFIGYGAEHSWYGGVSWVVTFPSNGRIGSGAMLHAGRFGHVAYVWRPFDADGKRRDGLLMSLDLYQYLAGAASKWKKLKAGAITNCESMQTCADSIAK